MKRFLAGQCCDAQRMMRSMVIVSALVTTAACSTGGSDGGSYYANNTIANVVSTGEAAVANDVEVRKVQSPHFLTNDPYTALSPDEIIRLYGK